MRPLLAYAAASSSTPIPTASTLPRPRGRARPRVFARARRPAVHGRRHAAPRQAHVPRRVRRGDGAARRRCTAGARVRSARALARCPTRAARARCSPRPRGAAAWPADRRSISLRSGETLSLPDARVDAPDEDGRADPCRGATRRRVRAPADRRRGARTRRLCARGRSRLPGRRRRARRRRLRGERSARPPARMPRRASRLTSRCSEWRRRRHARSPSCAKPGAALALAGFGARPPACASSPTGSCCARIRPSRPQSDVSAARHDRRSRRAAPPRAIATAGARARVARVRHLPRSRKPAVISHRTSAPSSSRSRCTTSSTRRTTASSGTWGTRPTRTRS